MNYRAFTKTFSIWIVLCIVLFVAGCTQNTSNNTNINTGKFLETGDVVLVDYVLTLEDGNVIDTNMESEAKKAWKYQTGRTYQPLQVVLGRGEVVPWFEKGLNTFTKIGETINISVNPEEWYGAIDPKRVWEVPLEIFTKWNIVPEVGVSYTFQNMQATVVAISGDIITVDTNSPLAGKVLKFKITLTDVIKKDSNTQTWDNK
jgi:peptidylprolyl isomerase